MCGAFAVLIPFLTHSAAYDVHFGIRASSKYQVYARADRTNRQEQRLHSS
jgi:hypothetical protein